MRKYIVIKKIIGWSIIFFILLTINFIGYSGEIKDPKSSLNVEEVKPSNDYFGLEIKWSVENNIDSDISAKITYFNPEVFLTYVNYEAKLKSWSSQEKEQKKQEVLNSLNEYLIFRFFLKSKKNPEYTKIIDSDWQACLIDDLGNKYLPEKIKEEEAELKSSYSGIFYGRIIYVYFPKYNNFNGKPILTKDTRWMKIEISKNSKAKEFKWLFSQQQEGKERTSSYNYFYLCLKVFLLALLILQIFLAWITRPSVALRNIRNI